MFNKDLFLFWANVDMPSDLCFWFCCCVFFPSCCPVFWFSVTFLVFYCISDQRDRVYVYMFKLFHFYAWYMLKSAYNYTVYTKETFNQLHKRDHTSQDILSSNMHAFSPEVKTKGAKRYVSINTDRRTVILKAILPLLCPWSVCVLSSDGIIYCNTLFLYHRMVLPTFCAYQDQTRVIKSICSFVPCPGADIFHSCSDRFICIF